jgi:hypothetical protein
MQAWVWTSIYGGNGNPIGKINGRETQHLMLIERGTPPPIVPLPPEQQHDPWTRQNHNYRRRAWYPWGREFAAQTLEAMLTPLCGKLKTQSRQPYLATANNGGYRNHECPNCIAMAAQAGVTPQYNNLLMQEDPWSLMPREDRMFTVDPVTGM